GHDVDHADSLLPTSQRNVNTDINQLIECFEIINYLIGSVPRVMKIEPALGFLHGGRDVREQTLFGLWSKALKGTQFPRFRGSFELRDRRYPQLILKLTDLLDTQSRHGGKFDDASRKLFSQSI